MSESQSNIEDPDLAGIPVVGCICIHGIGNRRKSPGHTVRHVAEAVRRGIEKTGGSFHPLPVPAVDRLMHRALVDLSDEQMVLDFYDGRWHESIPSPPLRTVFWWSLRIAPLLPMLLASAWLSDRDVEDGGNSANLALADKLLSSCLVLVTTACLLLLLIPLGLIAAVLAVPSQRIRIALYRVLVEVLGDAWLYRSDQLDARVLPKLTDVTSDVARMSDEFVLIGHSQGGEIARRVSLEHTPLSCVAVGTGEAPLGVLRVLRANPLSWILYWVFFGAYPALLVWSMRGVGILVQDFLSTMGNLLEELLISIRTGQPPSLDGVSSFAPFAGLVQQFLPLVVLVLFVVTIGLATRRPKDLGQRADCENFQIKSLLDPVSYGSSDNKDILRFQPRSGILWSLAEHVHYFETTHTGVFLTEAIFGSEAVPAGRKWAAARISWLTRVLGLLATTIFLVVTWWLGSWQIDFIRAWIG